MESLSSSMTRGAHAQPRPWPSRCTALHSARDMGRTRQRPAAARAAAESSSSAPRGGSSIPSQRQRSAARDPRAFSASDAALSLGMRSQAVGLEEPEQQVETRGSWGRMQVATDDEMMDDAPPPPAPRASSRPLKINTDLRLVRRPTRTLDETRRGGGGGGRSSVVVLCGCHSCRAGVHERRPAASTRSAQRTAQPQRRPLKPPLPPTTTTQQPNNEINSTARGWRA